VAKQKLHPGAPQAKGVGFLLGHEAKSLPDKLAGPAIPHCLASGTLSLLIGLLPPVLSTLSADSNLLLKDLSTYIDVLPGGRTLSFC
jgi:hypothetical protein